MTDYINAIKTLCNKSKDTASSIEALQFTQAALNLAHVAQVIKQVEEK